MTDPIRTSAAVRSRWAGWAWAVMCAFALVGPACAALPTGFVDETVIGSLAFPVSLAFLPDGRVLLIEQFSARIKLVRFSPATHADSVGFVSGVNTGGERGLLGVAIDPQWPDRPYVYTHSTDVSGKVRISRFRASGALSDPTGLISVDPASRYDLINDAPDNASNHNGGTVRFGPDGMLYVTLGDDAVGSAAQDTAALQGKVLRLDVSNLPDGAGTATRAQLTPPDNPFTNTGSPNARLVWVWGLRNPFRLQIDSFTGTVIIGDVGENTWEEIDEAPAGGGYNFGWPHYEGFSVFNSGQSLTGPAIMPMYVINHSEGARAIISAGLYRHRAGATRAYPAEYEDNVFLSDYYSGTLRRLVRMGSGWVLAPQAPGQSDSINWGTGYDQVSDWASGPEGGMWYVKQNGTLHRIMNAGTTAVGANASPVDFAAPYPTPARGPIHFAWTLASAGHIELAIVDVRGRRIRTVVESSMSTAGPHATTWDGRDARGKLVRSGVYFAVLTVGKERATKKIAIVR